MRVKIKKLDQNAIIPKYAKPGDAAVDLTATSVEAKRNQVIYGTGLAIEVPEGHVGLLFSRSSICKKDLILSNAVGVLDSGYRGEIKFIFNKKYDTFNDVYGIGERIGQLMIIPYPTIEFDEVNELSNTERGQNGWGSSGN